MKTVTAVIFFLALIMPSIIPNLTYGHGGGLNSAGCHTNRKTGGYHCHRSYRSPRRVVNYCHVINEEHRCGYALSTCRNLVSQFGGYCAKQ